MSYLTVTAEQYRKAVKVVRNIGDEYYIECEAEEDLKAIVEALGFSDLLVSGTVG